jgi:quercetin dioxygenase-like cupin family protein
MADAAQQGFRVARGEDRFGAHYGLGFGALAFKVSTADSGGALLVVELAHHAKGGPPRHLHHHQDEWFYVLAGAYVLEVGQERFRLSPGDSVFAPREVPHCWAYVGEQPGRIAIVFTPAGRMEAFFAEISKADGPAPQDPAFWPVYGMELVGPPLALG